MKQIIAIIFAQNTYGYLSALPSRSISCDGASVEGLEWMTPYLSPSGINLGYRRVIQVAKPTPDSVKTIRVRIQNQTYWILVKDGDAVSVFAAACNKCCSEGTPTIATDPIPELIIEDEVPIGVDSKYRFLAPLPPVIAGQALTFKMSHSNGTVVTAPGTYANEAALLTYLNANYSAVGVFDIIASTNANGNILRLTSLTIKTALMIVGKSTQTKSVSGLAFPATVVSVANNGTTYAVNKVAANASELIAAIGKYFADGTLTATSATVVQYVGSGVPGNVTLASGAVAFS